MIKKNFVILLINIICFYLFLFDRLTKYFALNFLNDKGNFVWENYYSGIGLVLSKNKNIAFSIKINTIFLYLLIVIILCYIIFLLIKVYKQKELKIILILSLTLIIIGAVSNLADRLIYGYVIDFISIFIWPVFNFADLFVVFGVGLWGYDIIKNKEYLPDLT